MDHSTPQQQLVFRQSRLSPDVPYGRGYERYAYRGDRQDNGSSDGWLSIFDYWRILKRRRWTLAVAALLGTLAGILVTLPRTPLYRARTTLEVQNMNSDFLNTRQINPVAGEDSTANVLTDVQTQMKILESEDLIQRVIDKLREDHKLGSALRRHGLLSWLREQLHLGNRNPANADYLLRKMAMANLTVRQMGQTRMIEISYQSSDPQFAADFLNTFGAEYIKSNLEARWKMSEHTGEWLAAQLEGMRVKLQKSEAALQEYAHRSGLLFTSPPSGNGPDKTNVSEEKLRQLQEELSRAQADRVAAQARYEVAKSQPPETLGDVLNDQFLRTLQGKLTDLRRQKAELVSIYTPKYENVRMVDAQIQSLQTEFEKERAAILGRIRNDYTAALGRERILAADYSAQSQVVMDQAGKSIQYNILKREADSNRQIYEAMLQQVKETSVASAIRASNIRIVDPAQIPREPFSPNLPFNSALGLFTGTVLGAGLALIRERGDRSLQFPGETPLWTKLPELGVIPSARLEARTAQESSRSALPGHRGSVARLPSPEPLKNELIAWTHKSGITAEACRTVLASILFVGENGTRPRVLAFTSDGPADGKTTTVSNIAVVAAEVHRKILIIDADLRRPRMHEVFGISNECGLGDLLCADTLEERVLDSVIRQTFIPNVYLLPSGPSLASASHLMYSPNLPVLLTRLKEEFDMVLVDTPPVLQATDARVIGRHVDSVVLVTHAGTTTHDAVVVVKQRFADDGTRVLGTILNDWKPDYSPNGCNGFYIGGDSLYKRNGLNRYFKRNNN
jgi:polysaccharide biosynthesis transport protein